MPRSRRRGDTRFLKRCRLLLGALDEAESCVGDAHRGLGGSLRVACPVAFGRLHLIARLKRFRERHPELHLDVHLSDRFDDLAREGIDLAIRVGSVQDPDLIADAVGSTRRVLVASPEYLRRQGIPRRLEDLSEHSCIVYTGQQRADVWSFADEIGVRTIDVHGEFRTNSSEGLLCAAVDAFGIAYAPLWLVDTDLRAGRLHRVIGNAQTERLPIWAAKHSSRRRSARIAALTDYLRHEFASDPLLAPVLPVIPPKHLTRLHLRPTSRCSMSPHSRRPSAAHDVSHPTATLTAPHAERIAALRIVGAAPFKALAVSALANTQEGRLIQLPPFFTSSQCNGGTGGFIAGHSQT